MPLTEPSSAAALGELIGQIGAPDFATRALDALNGSVQAASWAVYRLRGDREPLLHLSAARGIEDPTRSCFAAYAGGLYRRDRSFDRVRAGGRAGEAEVLRMHADEAPNPDHRDAIYRRHRMLERLSVAALEDDGALLAVNLYHHEHQGRFSAAEQERFAALAPLVLAAVRRHLAIVDQPPPEPRQALLAACPALTARELDVCERLLRGWSHDGIAADLGVSVATVKTYRARAFERLGLHFRSELFARFGARG